MAKQTNKNKEKNRYRHQKINIRPSGKRRHKITRRTTN